MSDEPVVKVTSEPGIASQFSKNKHAYQNIKRSETPYGLGLILSVPAVLLLAIFLETPSKSAKEDRTSEFLGLEVPREQFGGKTITIPELSSEDTARHDSNRGSSNSSSKIPKKLSGPEILNRGPGVTIPPGSTIKAVLLTGASDGLVKAQTLEPLIVNGDTLIPENAIFVGSGQSGNDRLSVHFTKVVLKDGSVTTVNAIASDKDDQIAGIKGSRISYRATKLATGIGLNFVGGITEGLQTSQGQSGALVTQPTMRNALLNGAATASLQESQEMMKESENEKPKIEVAVGTSILITFSE